ncbi:competence/damage-inducible protein A [Nitrospina gracilis]|uniref:competence/damage-inducible protein A n=1 Tax=Nitrospina gracilis TaxID=35801 RepID=UPI001F343708|nr:competence/damage-inducible protein A [Nitrospina gracilis]MCF8720308.1 nicotinamide-nucleotide amidase [Nitrospina gracilis Nb-211]
MKTRNDIPQAEIVAVGNELLNGLVSDTNSTFICGQLRSHGLQVGRISVVGDDAEAIRSALDQALSRVDLVIVTGGLGATHDDITKDVLAEYFGTTLARDPKVEAMIRVFFEKRQRPVPDAALRQAEVPKDGRTLYNDQGTAPGLMFERGGQRVYVLPGVPREAEYLTRQYILPDVAPSGNLCLQQRMLWTTGLVESALWEMFGPMDTLESLVQVASLPSHLGVRIHLTAYGKNVEETSAKLEQAETLLSNVLSSYIYARDEQTMESVLGRLLADRGETVAVAESCTGGLIGHRLTNVPGSSRYFLQGWLTYSNEAKIKNLGVDAELLERHGAVSEEVARAMAEGARRCAGTDWAVAVTGIAGPDGGTATKPVGLTYISVAGESLTSCQKFVFPQDRVRNKERAAQAALNLLRLHLIGLK